MFAFSLLLSLLFNPLLMTKGSVATSNISQEASYNEEIVFSSNGVTFTYKKSICSNIKERKIAATPLSNSDDKPDYVLPEHITFQFQNYPTKIKNQLFEPQIKIIEIEKVKSVFKLNTDYAKVFETNLEFLWEKLQDSKYKAVSAKIPYLLWNDLTETFSTKPQRIEFKNGSGFFYLTQFANDVALINNEGLLAMFQGITSDKKYYVLITFPLNLTSLPNDFQTQRTKEYTLPTYFYSKNKLAVNNKNYQKYILNVTNQIEQKSKTSFTPNIEDLTNIVKSLKINTVQ